MSTILCINGGSSSLKFALYEVIEDARRIADGELENIGLEGGLLWVRRGSKPPVTIKAFFNSHQEAVQALFQLMHEHGLPQPTAVGHRLVHGGVDYFQPTRIDLSLRERLHELIPFAPLHLPGELAAIDAVTHHFPDLPQVVCFDTAFHHHLPIVARCYALPRSLWDEGVLRYGFHGLSYESIVAQLGSELPERLVVAHLGNGASLAAIQRGRSIDTTMGLTPTGGVMMGTRSGDLDPGVLIYLMRKKGYDCDQLEHLVNFEAGLKGVSGATSDMKVLLERGNTPAEEAITMFAYQVRKQIGAMAAALGGLDLMVFTGGIGERAASVREAIWAPLHYLKAEMRVMATDEDGVIARQTHEVMVA